MKKSTLLLAMAITLNVSHCVAQIPNAGFENLNSDNSIKNWGILTLFVINIDTNGVIIDSIYIDQSFCATTTDAHTGQRAMEMRNAYVYGSNQGYAGGGILTNDSIFGGFATPVFLQGTPTDFNFYYKYFPLNNDTAQAVVEVYDSTENMIGSAQLLIFDTVSNYTLASIPIIYDMPVNPAYVNIRFFNFYTESIYVRQPTLGTRFLVDDVSFSMATNVTDLMVGKDSYAVFPNPSSSIITIQYSMEIKDVKLYNGCGKLLLQEIGNIKKIDVSQMEPGIYILEISTNKGLQRTKLLKR